MGFSPLYPPILLIRSVWLTGGRSLSLVLNRTQFVYFSVYNVTSPVEQQETIPPPQVLEKSESFYSAQYRSVYLRTGLHEGTKRTWYTPHNQRCDHQVVRETRRKAWVPPSAVGRITKSEQISSAARRWQQVNVV